MKNRLRSRKGMTLAELLVASVLMALVALATIPFSSVLTRSSVGIEATFAPITEANLALETLYRMVINAPVFAVVGGTNIYFQIDPGGQGVQFKSSGGGVNHAVQEGGDLVLHAASGDTQILSHNVKSVNFSQIPSPFDALVMTLVVYNGKPPSPLTGWIPSLVPSAWAQTSTPTETVSTTVSPRKPCPAPCALN